jgi:hypothetical protein
MPRKATGYREDLAQIFQQVLGTTTQTAAEQLTEGLVTHSTFGRALRGKVLEYETYARIATYLAPRFCKHYGTEIETLFGQCTPDTVTEWLCLKAGLRPLPLDKQAPASEILGALAFDGADELPAEDLATLGAIVKAFIQQRRTARGLD